MFSSISAAGGAKSTQSTKNTKQNCSKFVHSHKIIKRDYSHRSPTRCCQFLCLLYQVIFFRSLWSIRRRFWFCFRMTQNPHSGEILFPFCLHEEENLLHSTALVFILVFLFVTMAFFQISSISLMVFLMRPYHISPHGNFIFLKTPQSTPVPRRWPKVIVCFREMRILRLILSNSPICVFLQPGESFLWQAARIPSTAGTNVSPGTGSAGNLASSHVLLSPPPLQAIHILCGTGSAQ